MLSDVASMECADCFPGRSRRSDVFPCLSRQAARSERFPTMELPRKALQDKVREDGVLDLSFQSLSEVPAWVWTLSHLRVLNLSHNNITQVKVPRDVNLPVLEHVDLSSNKLEELPLQFAALAASPTFQFLDVSSNQIENVRAQSGFCVKSLTLFSCRTSSTSCLRPESSGCTQTTPWGALRTIQSGEAGTASCQRKDFTWCGSASGHGGC